MDCKQTVNEITAAATEWYDQRDIGARQLLDRIEKDVASWPAVADEAFIAAVAEDLKEKVPALKDEDASHYAARLLTLQVAWRKDQEAFDEAWASCELIDWLREQGDDDWMP